MNQSICVLLKLIRIAIDRETDYSFPSDVDWREVMKLSIAQEVAPIAFDGLQKFIDESDAGLPMGFHESENLKYEWLSYVLEVEKNYAKQLDAISRLNDVFGKEKLPFIIMKGVSLAQYYPVPEHRVCGDVDIYLGENYRRSNLLLEENGIDYVESYYRHSASFIDGIKVENHDVLCDTRGPEKWKEFERTIESEAHKVLASADGGMVYPSANFNAMFLPWHASSHFMFDKISLRQVLDWMLFLLGNGNDVDERKYSSDRDNNEYSFGVFSNVLTALGMRWFNIKETDIPLVFVDGVRFADTSLVERVSDYVFFADSKEISSNIWKTRFRMAERAWKARWKYKELYGMNYIQLLFYKIRGVLHGSL